MFLGKGVLKICSKFTGEHLCRTVISINMGKNIFSHPYIHYMASERLQGEEQIHTKNYFLEMSHFHPKMRLKSAPQKLNF